MTKIEFKAMKWEEQDKHMHTLVATVSRGIVAALAGTWKIQELKTNSGSCTLGNADGAMLSVNTEDRNPERIIVRGHHKFRPDIYYTGVDFGCISVAESRGAAAIAKEIERRLLPGYLEALKEFNKRCEQADQHKRNVSDNRERIARALGSAGRVTSDEMVCLYRESPYVSADFQIMSTSIEIKRLSCSVELAVKIAELLKSAQVSAKKIIS